MAAQVVHYSGSRRTVCKEEISSKLITNWYIRPYPVEYSGSRQAQILCSMPAAVGTWWLCFWRSWVSFLEDVEPELD